MAARGADVGVPIPLTTSPTPGKTGMYRRQPDSPILLPQAG